MAENKSNIDELLSAAQQQKESAEASNNGKLAKLLTDLEMRWAQIADKGMTEPLLETVTGFESQEDELRETVVAAEQDLAELSTKTTEVLENEAVDEDLKAQIRETFMGDKELLEGKVSEAKEKLQKHSSRAMEVRRNYADATEFKNKFNRRFNEYSSDVDGVSILKTLVGDNWTNEDDQAWFYENLLTADEQKYVDKLREEGWDNLGIKKEVFEKARKEIKTQVSEKISAAITDSFVFPKLNVNELEPTDVMPQKFSEKLDEVEAMLEEDARKVAEVKKWMDENLGERGFEEVAKEIEQKVADSKDDLAAYKAGKKGLGKNSSTNRRARLVEVRNAEGNKLNKVYKEEYDEASDVSQFLYDVNDERYALSEGRKDVENIDGWEKMPEEIQLMMKQLFDGEASNKDLSSSLRKMKKQSFANMDNESELAKRIDSLSDAVERGRGDEPRKLCEKANEKRKEVNDEYGKLGEKFSEFPR